jgi:hypothetical protein
MNFLPFFRRRPAYNGSLLLRLAGGGILFLVAAGILWTNEARVDFGRIAERSVPITAEQVTTDVEGKLVAIQGSLVTDEDVGDLPFLRPGPYIELVRHAEMYAWEERRRSDASGSSTEKDPADYEYSLVWTSNPEDSSKFASPTLHSNPAMAIQPVKLRASRAHIGRYQLDPREMDLPSASQLNLDREIVGVSPDWRVVGNLIYMGRGTPTAPRIGDLRIQYTAVASGIQVTAFGELSGDILTPYLYRGKHKFYRAFAVSRDAAIEQMSREYRNLLWGMRAAGLILMWVSFMLVFSPLSALLGGIPVLGGLSRFLLGIVALLLASVIAIGIIAVSVVVHNPLILAAGVVLIMAAAVGWAWLRKGQTADEQMGEAG